MLSEDAKNVVSQCRALVISQKNSTRVQDLLREYQKLEGTPMDFRKYGFKTVEDFLTASREFIVSQIRGETYIEARPAKETEHLVKMVQRQKGTKKQPNRKPYSSDQSWNKSSYSSSVYSRIQARPPLRKLIPPKQGVIKSSDNNNNYKSKPNGQMLSNMKQNKNITSDQQKIDSRNRMPNNREIIPPARSQTPPAPQLQRQPQPPMADLRERIIAKKKAKFPNDFIVSRAILGQNNKDSNPNPNPKKLVTKSPTVASETAKPIFDSNNVNNRLRGISASVSKISIQDRLKIRQQMPTATVIEPISASRDSSTTSNKSVIIKKEMYKKEREAKVEKSTPIVFEFDPRMDAVTSLALYCQVRHIAEPNYKIIPMKNSPRFQCQVLVNGVAYSTYPEDFETKGKSMTACAVAAIQQIQIDEARNRYPICMDSDIELAMKIFQELRNHPHGIFRKNIPELFQTTFEQTLPDHWLSVIQSPRLFITETVGDNLIVLANIESSDSSSTSSVSDSDFIVLDRINLPWHEKYWNLYITYCNSTVDVWARIVGKEYSDQLDAIMTEVDLSMLTSKTRPTSIMCGQIYFISFSECWHRVRVENMNKSTGKCYCFFIDFGDEEWLPMDQLFVCEPRYLRLPSQAIPLSLYGLEDFAENPNAKIHLDQMLIGKTLIGEILTKKDTVDMNDSCTGFNDRIQVVLYDTSSNEDVNLNPKLLTEICDDTPPPELKRAGVATNVNVTHVNMNGEIFVQVKNVGLSYVQKLINQLVESKFKEEEHQVVLADLKKPDSLFLIQDMDDLKWYRGAMVPEDNKIDGNQYNIFYVDSGMTKLTNISRIFRLESLSAALSKFPRQALRVKLHNLPAIDESIVARLRGLLPAGSPAIVKLAVHAIVPQVIIYRRFEQNGILFNVNEVILIEYELESSSDLQESSAGTINDSIISDMRCNSAASTHGSMKSPLTVPASPQKTDLQKLYENVSIPPIDEFFDVFVSMTSNPSNFVIQPYCEGPKLAELMTSLQEYCQNSDEFIPGDMVEKGQAYAAPNSDGVFHRVTVENIFDSDTILVCYCDFGEVAVVSNDKLKTLPAKFRTLSKQAIMAKLHGIKPKHGDWTMDDCMRFRELAVGQRFVSIIKNIADDAVCPNSQIVELQLVDVKTAEDIYIHEVLIHEGRAVADA